MSRPAPQLPIPAAIDFGAPSAERDIERGLEEYFVESEAYNRVRSGAKRIVVGNRGIGKSAIFRSWPTVSETRAAMSSSCLPRTTPMSR